MPKFTVTTADVSGVVVMKDADDWREQSELVVAASTMKEACDYLMGQAGEPVYTRTETVHSKTDAEIAYWIVAVAGTGDRVRKIAAIRLFHSITGAGLKESKEAVEDAMERLPSDHW